MNTDPGGDAATGERMQHANRWARPSRDALRAGVLAAMLAANTAAGAQQLDCARLQRQIAADRGGRGGPALRRMMNELARTQTYAQQRGCDGFVLFGGDPQCPGLNGRIQQLQAAVAQMQAGGGGGRAELVARFDAYCRGAPPAQPPGFFDQLFGALAPQQSPPPPPAALDDASPEDDRPRRGGSQAVCVRSCDGGFFPLSVSARHAPEDLTQMCQALCPGAEASVFTRAPDADIKTAVGLDGRSYSELTNALLFQKSYTPACSCRPAGKGWAEALANAEEVLNSTRKGDIVVTPEKSAELSRPMGAAPRSPSPTPAAPAASVVVPAAAGRPAIRQVGPQP